MSVTVDIPSLLADAADGRASVELEGGDVNELCASLRQQWPALATLVLNEQNRLREHVLLLLNGKVTRHLEQGNPKVSAGDRLAIVQAVSGG